MSRQIDKACEPEQFYREQALAAHFDNQRQDGTGVCLSCGEDIDPARLAVNPRFERCVTCQERFEYRKKHAGRPQRILVNDLYRGHRRGGHRSAAAQ